MKLTFTENGESRSVETERSILIELSNGQEFRIGTGTDYLSVDAFDEMIFIHPVNKNKIYVK